MTDLAPARRVAAPATTAPRIGAGPRIAIWIAAGVLALLAIKWVLMTVFLLVVPFGLWWVVDRACRGRRARAAEETAARAAAARRAEVESRAVVDAAGGCGWCGSRAAHRDGRGRLVMPREHHRDDIEQTLAVA